MRSRLYPDQSSPSSLSSLIASSETTREGFFPLSIAVHSPRQLLLPCRSHIRGLHSVCLSHASCPICGLNGFFTNCRERVGTQGQDPVADPTLLLALPSDQTIFHVHSQVECPTVHDRATRCASFFYSVLPLLILLHSRFRCRHHHTVLRFPVRREIFNAICKCIYRSHRLCFHLGRPHGFDHLLRPDASGAPGSPTTSQIPVHQAHCYVYLVPGTSVPAMHWHYLTFYYRASSSQYYKAKESFVKRVRTFVHFLGTPCSPLLEFWTATNVAHGLNALATCIEVRRYFSVLIFPF